MNGQYNTDLLNCNEKDPLIVPRGTKLAATMFHVEHKRSILTYNVSRGTISTRDD